MDGRMDGRMVGVVGVAGIHVHKKVMDGKINGIKIGKMFGMMHGKVDGRVDGNKDGMENLMDTQKILGVIQINGIVVMGLNNMDGRMEGKVGLNNKQEIEMNREDLMDQMDHSDGPNNRVIKIDGEDLMDGINNNKDGEMDLIDLKAQKDLMDGIKIKEIKMGLIDGHNGNNKTIKMDSKDQMGLKVLKEQMVPMVGVAPTAGLNNNHNNNKVEMGHKDHKDPKDKLDLKVGEDQMVGLNEIKW